MRIVHIDDDPDHRLIVSCIIGDHKPEAVTLEQYGSAEEVEPILDALNGSAFVVSDHMMPGERGADLLRRHADDLIEKGIPAYLLTSYPDDEAVVRALEAGVTGVIEKAVMYDDFEARLLSILEPWWSGRSPAPSAAKVS